MIISSLQDVNDDERNGNSGSSGPIVAATEKKKRDGPAADMKLGLATAPVLFATKKHPQLNDLIARRFGWPGDVEEAFKLVLESGGLEETKSLARQYCGDATAALDHIRDSSYRSALVGLCDKVLNRLN